MDIDEKEKLEELRKIEERRRRIALKNCKIPKLFIKIIKINKNRPKRNRGNKA